MNSQAFARRIEVGQKLREFCVGLRVFPHIAAELFAGAGLGTCDAGVLQTPDPDRFAAIDSSAGWIASLVYWTPCLHSPFG